MGDLKNKTLKNNTNSEDTQTHTLLPREADLLRTLNEVLSFHTLKQDIISQFLFYITVYRLKYPEEGMFSFGFDFLDKEATELTVTVLPPTPPTV